jgi:hypothetical protein
MGLSVNECSRGVAQSSERSKKSNKRQQPQNLLASRNASDVHGSSHTLKKIFPSVIRNKFPVKNSLNIQRFVHWPCLSFKI